MSLHVILTTGSTCDAEYNEKGDALHDEDSRLYFLSTKCFEGELCVCQIDREVGRDGGRIRETRRSKTKTNGKSGDNSIQELS